MSYKTFIKSKEKESKSINKGLESFLKAKEEEHEKKKC